MSRKTRNAKKTRKERLFWQGVAAFKRFSGTSEDRYLCPLCFRLFVFDELSDLTLEHFPPKSVGGDGICLTCRECNSVAGHTYDYAPAERERMEDLAAVLKGEPREFKSRVRIRVGDIETNAVLVVEAGRVTITVGENNNPKSIEAQISHFANPTEETKKAPSFGLTVPFKFGHTQLIVSDLRAGYLAVFAFFGYALITRPPYEIVREQLRSPKEQIIKPIVQMKDDFINVPPSRVIAYMTEPIRALAVYLHPGRSRMTLLPTWNSPSDFFANLESLYMRGEGVKVAATDVGWPLEPEFLIDTTAPLKSESEKPQSIESDTSATSFND